jgi:hypothetical protein
MSRWPTIDWPAFGAAVDAALHELSSKSISTRSLHHVGKSAMWRARRGVSISAANYVAICTLFGWEPAAFLLNAPPPLAQELPALAAKVSRQTFDETNWPTASDDASPQTGERARGSPPNRDH